MITDADISEVSKGVSGREGVDYGIHAILNKIKKIDVRLEHSSSTWCNNRKNV